MSETKADIINNRGFAGSVESEEWRKYRGEAYEAYRRNWYQYPKDRYLSEFPLHLDIEPTNACNLKCGMCPRTIMIKKGTMPKIGYMNFDFYKRLIDEGSVNGLASIKFNFMGEPLLHPQIVEMVAYAKAAGIIDTMINTNAVLLTGEMSEALLDAGLDNLFVSIDSVFKERYEAIRVGAKYEDVVEKVEKFVQLKKTKGKHHVQTRVSMVVMDENADEIDLFKKQWSGLVDSVGWGPATEDRGQESEQINPDFCCEQLWQRLLVAWDGTCTPCCADEERELVVGNALTSPLKEIWLASPTYLRLREYHSTGRYHEIKRCRCCPVARIP